VRIIKQTITDIITRGESVRGSKEADEDDKPMLPAKTAADPAERKSLLGSLFGGGKK
jgi:preprotein translocase subunit YajC